MLHSAKRCRRPERIRATTTSDRISLGASKGWPRRSCRGRLFRAVHGKELPDWAKAFAGSWAQFFLKFGEFVARLNAAACR